MNLADALGPKSFDKGDRIIKQGNYMAIVVAPTLKHDIFIISRQNEDTNSILFHCGGGGGYVKCRRRR